MKFILKYTAAFLILIALVSTSFADSAELQTTQSKPDDEKPKSGTIIIPIASYRDETNVMLGAAMIRYFKLDSATEKLSSLNAVGMYTFNNQMVLLLSTALRYDDSTINLGISHRNYPTRFYGIGNNVGDNYEEYTPYSFSAKAGYFHNLTETFSVGSNIFVQSHKIIESGDIMLLSNGIIPGLDDSFISGLTLEVKWDSRNGTFYPTDSSLVHLSASFFDNLIGSDYDFTTYTFDMRQYIGLDDKTVFAYQFYGSFSTGNVPFYMLSKYMLRGYYLGKFMDRNIIFARIEYRYLPVFWRLGFVTFASIGEIAGRLNEFSTNNLKLAAGVGLRFIIDKAHKINFRFDIAIGDEISVYFAAMEIF